MANTVDADFLALPLSALSDAAIDAAKAAGASHVDVRIERTRTGYLSLRDAFKNKLDHQEVAGAALVFVGNSDAKELRLRG